MCALRLVVVYGMSTVRDGIIFPVITFFFNFQLQRFTIENSITVQSDSAVSVFLLATIFRDDLKTKCFLGLRTYFLTRCVSARTRRGDMRNEKRKGETHHSFLLAGIRSSLRRSFCVSFFFVTYSLSIDAQP